ncbi:IclR family transcriptional regulator [Paramixta manurensis]|uniref:IclR family transcriptional regulator n=1 Tax=Paramixta manurensis TaxID=2740817 RepID=A0A6M8U6S7_9GAMM|nr:IclR family transcriptional regulator [Erwiniaceae bacterium PD-1]
MAELKSAQIKEDDNVEDRYRAPALDKGLDILEALAGREEGVSQAEIAKTLGRKPNEIYRMLDRLVRRGYVIRTSIDQYELSLKLFELANRHSPFRRLATQTLPYLRRFAHEAQQACHLVVYDRGGMTAIAQVDAPGYWSFGIRVGSRMGLLDTGSGHVMLAFSSASEQEFMLREESEGKHGALSAEMKQQLAVIRQQGHEMMPSQQTEGVYNIAVPVFANGDNAIAVLTCPYLQHLDYMNSPSREETLALLKRTVTQIMSATPLFSP